ncbi:MAG: hypothetical protein Q4G10_09400 [Bacteroidia bacterium]|nr:hypothetical protein [Bacteroidia bacterium]
MAQENYDEEYDEIEYTEEMMKQMRAAMSKAARRWPVRNCAGPKLPVSELQNGEHEE